LPAGVDLMKKYTVELEEFEEKRLDFTNAEKLFELPITMYPALMKVQKDMKGLESIFTLYSQQKVSTACN
jgi:dynein heavy chain